MEHAHIRVGGFNVNAAHSNHSRQALLNRQSIHIQANIQVQLLADQIMNPNTGPTLHHTSGLAWREQAEFISCVLPFSIAWTARTLARRWLCCVARVGSCDWMLSLWRSHQHRASGRPVVKHWSNTHTRVLRCGCGMLLDERISVSTIGLTQMWKSCHNHYGHYWYHNNTILLQICNLSS